MTSSMPPKLLGSPGHDEPAESEDEADVTLNFQRRVTKGTASAMASMEVKSPELLRATWSSSALQCCGRALHHSFSGDLHHKSFETKGFDCFWSHSWHGKSWQKILLLMVVNNGLAAVITGNLAALFGMTLFYFRLLPSYRRPFQRMQATYDFGPWGFVFGCVATFAMLFLWQSSSKVFLDRICIHQKDIDRKRDGILSLGGFLKHSRSMLVLWDATYPTRLWTMFELAAFLKSHGDESHLLIRPTILGPTAICGFLCIGFVFMAQILVSSDNSMRDSLVHIGVPLIICVGFVHLLRRYCEWVETAWLQLRSFSLVDAKTHCCSSNHVDETGAIVACDREIILECLRTWFGSEEEFELWVRSQVSLALEQGLGSKRFLLSWFLGISSCISWGFGDLVMATLRAKDYYFALVYSLDAFVIPFAYGPFLYLSCLVLGRLRRRRNTLLNYMVSLFGGLFIVLALVVPRLLRQLMYGFLGDVLLASALWGTSMAVIATVALWIWTRLLGPALFCLREASKCINGFIVENCYKSDSCMLHFIIFHICFHLSIDLHHVVFSFPYSAIECLPFVCGSNSGEGNTSPDTSGGSPRFSHLFAAATALFIVS